MRLEDLEVIVTDHAYTRRCQRVGPIERTEMTQQLQQAVANGDSVLDKEGYLKACGAWYMSIKTDDKLMLVTCYGDTHMDLPAAKRWERHNKDRINLGGEQDEMVDSLFALLGPTGSAIPT